MPRSSPPKQRLTTCENPSWSQLLEERFEQLEGLAFGGRRQLVARVRSHHVCGRGKTGVVLPKRTIPKPLQSDALYTRLEVDGPRGTVTDPRDRAERQRTELERLARW